MKKLITIAIILAISSSLYASEDVKSTEVKKEEIKVEGSEKIGFFTTKWCAQKGMLSNCRLESAVCGSGNCFKNWNPGDPEINNFVLFVHDERKVYNVKLDGVEKNKILREALNRNEVSIIGKIDNNTITATSFKAPPRQKSAFFKGCL